MCVYMYIYKDRHTHTHTNMIFLKETLNIAVLSFQKIMGSKNCPICYRQGLEYDGYCKLAIITWVIIQKGDWFICYVWRISCQLGSCHGTHRPSEELLAPDWQDHRMGLRSLKDWLCHGTEVIWGSGPPPGPLTERAQLRIVHVQLESLGHLLPPKLFQRTVTYLQQKQRQQGGENDNWSNVPGVIGAWQFRIHSYRCEFEAAITHRFTKAKTTVFKKSIT